MIIDIRTSEEKENIRNCRVSYTFRVTSCNVWQDRPQLINFEPVKVKNWRPSVHYFEKFDTIVLIALGEKTKNVALIFYDTTHFYELQRLPVKRKHFDCAMIVNETA